MQFIINGFGYKNGYKIIKNELIKLIESYFINFFILLYCVLQRNAPYVRSKWSEEGVSMELKEAMKAHAIYGYPKFLFKEKHQGRMVMINPFLRFSEH